MAIDTIWLLTAAFAFFHARVRQHLCGACHDAASGTGPIAAAVAPDARPAPSRP